MFFLSDQAKLEKLCGLLVKRTEGLERELAAELYYDLWVTRENNQFSAVDQQFINKYNINSNITPLLQAQEFFSWGALCSMLTSDENPIARLTNHQGQCFFYTKLAEHAKDIQTEIQNKNYSKAMLLANNTFNPQLEVPTALDNSSGTVVIKVGRTGCRGRGFILGDLFWGITGIVNSIVFLVTSLILAPFFCCAGSQYFGTLSFDLDMVLWLLDSIRQLSFALIFPLGMLYAKHQTDSYDTTKGEVTRLLESIIACCQRIQDNSTPPSEEKTPEPRLTDSSNSNADALD